MTVSKLPSQGEPWVWGKSRRTVNFSGCQVLSLGLPEPRSDTSWRTCLGKPVVCTIQTAD